MGIDIGCVLIVGVPADELVMNDDEDLYDFVHRNDLDYSSPWYDSGVDSGVIGRVVAGSDDYTKVDLTTLNDDITAAMNEIKNLTGLQPALYLSNHVT